MLKSNTYVDDEGASELGDDDEDGGGSNMVSGLKKEVVAALLEPELEPREEEESAIVAEEDEEGPEDDDEDIEGEEEDEACPGVEPVAAWDAAPVEDRPALEALLELTLMVRTGIRPARICLCWKQRMRFPRWDR